MIGSNVNSVRLDDWIAVIGSNLRSVRVYDWTAKRATIAGKGQVESLSETSPDKDTGESGNVFIIYCIL